MRRCRLARHPIRSLQPPSDTRKPVLSLRRLASLTLGAALCQAWQAASAEEAWDCRGTAADAGWECRASDAPPGGKSPARPVPPATSAKHSPSETPPPAGPAPSRAPAASRGPRSGTAKSARAPPVASGAVAAPAAIAHAPAPGGSSPASTIAVPASIDAGLPWTYCGPPPPEVVEAEADAAEGRLGDEVVALSGDVRVRRGSDVLRADLADYDRARDLIDARGNVLLARPDARVTGETARLDMATDRGEMTAVEYRLVGSNARGTADVARFLGSSVSEYENITYTTCRPGRDDWVLEAGELQIDRAEGLGDARDATLRLGGVPVAYLPRFVFPIETPGDSTSRSPTTSTSRPTTTRPSCLGTCRSAA
ncbi:MAG: organic solvent tolerance protein OstA [Acidobacteria bacterium]|nr:organic solvent tolerance protein OstA [Acidobacteriota bacterium]